MTVLKFLDTSETGHRIPILCKTSDQVDIAVAYLKKNGFALLRDPLTLLLRRGGVVRIVVGIDPFHITDGSAVISLYNLLSEYPLVQAELRYYADSAFHPKLYIFKRGGQIAAIVGSSNLTRAAMESNIEANLLVEGDLGESVIATIADYFDRGIWKPCKGKLSHDLLGKLRRYDKLRPRRVGAVRSTLKIPSSRIRRRPITRPSRLRIRRIAAETVPTQGALPDMVLIREIPKASGRVAQVHFTREIIERFFRLRLGSRHAIEIQQQLPGGKLGRIEKRTLVYSLANRNPKIEIEGAKILEGNYPTKGRPIIVIHALKTGRYKYVMRLPGDKSYKELAAVLSKEPRKGIALPFKITDLNALSQMLSNRSS
jgi:HKD family nuclease